MTTIKTGDRVRVLTGDYRDEIGVVYAIPPFPAYPIVVKFEHGHLNAYYEEQVEMVDEEATS